MSAKILWFFSKGNISTAIILTSESGRWTFSENEQLLVFGDN